MSILQATFLVLSTTLTLSAQQLSHPEAFAGRWEASDGQGGEIGMNLIVSTTVPSAATNLVGLPQDLENITIGVYHRSGSDVASDGFRYFETSPDGGATWDGDHLHIKFRQEFDSPATNIDVTWVAASHAWVGTFERGTFKNLSATLHRPTALQTSSFVGTWFNNSGIMNNCLHIAQAPDRGLTGWADDIELPGQVRYRNGLHAPDRVREHFGEIAVATAPTPVHIEVTLRAYTAGCCPLPFAATLSHDGNTLVGNWVDGSGNRDPQRPVTWSRVRGDSCIATASVSHRQATMPSCPTIPRTP